MTERPDDLDTLPLRRGDKWRQRREVEPAILLDEMPAHSLAGHADAETTQPGIVLVRLFDVLGGGEHIDANAVLVAVRGRLEAGLPERGKMRRVDCYRHP